MNKKAPMEIKQLDKKTINKIAAGEVVERPASVVKELVENSIDAQATEIFITIENHGLDLIKIIDNGKGMSKEDAALSWKSHTTSKLKAIEDLDNLTSLGFRGEALASISAVSIMEILTKRKQDLTGTFIRIKGGSIDLKEEKECTTGTIITVKNLFYNVPARKKFLKKPSTELGHIIDIVNRQALIRPDIHFKLTHNNAVLLNSPQSKNTLDPLIAVFGIDNAKEMIPLFLEKKDVRITGYISKPSLSRATRDYEIFYINNRYIKSKILSKAVEEAYRTLLMKNRFPIVVLNIELDPAKVDVNIHPTKREVRFSYANEYAKIITEAVISVLEQNDLWRREKGLLTSHSEVAQTGFKKDKNGSLMISKDAVENSLKESLKDRTKGTIALDSQLSFSKEGIREKDATKLQAEKNIVFMDDSFWLRPLGQAHKLYILCESSDGIAIIDIHAAHERLKYEQLLEQYSKSKLELQELIHPITLKFTKEQAVFLEANKEQLTKIGITIEPFGGSTYIIRKMPVIMGLSRTEEDIKEFIDEMREELVKIKDVNERLDLIIKTMACHSVVRSGEAVSLTKVRTILTDLSNCNQPFTCPHGRPTIIRITQKNLEKEFGRIV